MRPLKVATFGFRFVRTDPGASRGVSGLWTNGARWTIPRGISGKMKDVVRDWVERSTVLADPQGVRVTLGARECVG